MAFFWTIPRRSYFQNLLAQQVAQSSSNAIYLVYLLGIVIAIAFALAKRQQAATAILSSKAAVFACSATAAIGGVLIHVGTAAMPSQATIAVLGSLMTACGFVALALTWAIASSKLPEKEMLVCSTLSFLASFVILWIGALSDFASTALSIAAPVVSGAFAAPSAGTTGEKDLPPSRFSLRKIAKTIPAGLIGTLMLSLLLGGVIRGFIYPGSFNDDPVLGSMSNAVSIVLALAFCIAILLANRKERFIYSMWTALLAFFLAGLLALAASHQDWTDAGKMVIVVGRSYLSFLLWVILIDSSSRHGVSPVSLIAAFFLTTETLASTLSYIAVPAIIHLAGIAFDAHIGTLAAISCFLLVVTAFVFLTKRIFDSPQTKNVAQRNLKALACEDIGEKFGLTNREVEITLLISQGNSVKRIASILVLSPSTVQTHSKNIYRKIDVHSKQELIDLVASHEARLAENQGSI